MNDRAPTIAQSWLTLSGVSLRLGSGLFLRDFNWTLREGEQWAILGPNGAGKTVLAELIGGKLHASGGQIEFATALQPARDIGWVSFELQKALCAEDSRHDISEYLASAVDSGTSVGALLAEHALDRLDVPVVARQLGIEALLDRGLRFLSSGEMRRALIARAVLQRPAVLILDNPYEGIDASSRRIVRDIVDVLLGGCTHVVLLTRQPQDIPAGISHVLLLDQGRRLTAGPREEVLSHPHTQRLFSDAAVNVAPAPLPGRANPDAAPLPDSVPLVELNDVHARYGALQVLDGVSLRLDAGEHLCIAGPNGCGKSTLLSLICGDNPRAYGQQVRLFGRLRGSGESVWEIKQRFGIVSNQLHLSYPRRASAFAVVASGFFDTLGLYDDCGPRQIEIARQWLELLGLDARRAARFDDLSFGEQRMMLLARAMVKSPPLLILDEPCSGLDAINRRLVLALIDRIGRESSTQILYVSHETDEMPACITRRLEFRRDDEGRYRLT